jgi:hypothetical protein
MCFYPIIERPLKAPVTMEDQMLCDLLTRPNALRVSPVSRVVL